MQKPTPDSFLARRLRVPVAWLRNEAAAGRLPSVRAGERYLFDAELVERLLLERAQHLPGTVAAPAPPAGSTSGAKP